MTGDNGEFRGRTEANLAGIARTLDEIKGQIGYNCPAGKETRAEVAALSKSVTVHHAQEKLREDERGIWHGYISPLLSAIVGGIVAWIIAKRG